MASNIARTRKARHGLKPCRQWSALREALGLSRREVARRSADRISVSTIGAIERYENKLTSFQQRGALARAVGVTTATLIPYLEGRMDLATLLSHSECEEADHWRQTQSLKRKAAAPAAPGPVPGTNLSKESGARLSFLRRCLGLNHERFAHLFPRAWCVSAEDVAAAERGEFGWPMPESFVQGAAAAVGVAPGQLLDYLAGLVAYEALAAMAKTRADVAVIDAAAGPLGRVARAWATAGAVNEFHAALDALTPSQHGQWDMMSFDDRARLASAAGAAPEHEESIPPLAPAAKARGRATIEEAEAKLGETFELLAQVKSALAGLRAQMEKVYGREAVAAALVKESG